MMRPLRKKDKTKTIIVNKTVKPCMDYIVKKKIVFMIIKQVKILTQYMTKTLL